MATVTPFEINQTHLPVEDLADDIIDLINTSYATMPWPKILQALDLARHGVKIRSVDIPIEQPPAEPVDPTA